MARNITSLKWHEIGSSTKQVHEKYVNKFESLWKTHGQELKDLGYAEKLVRIKSDFDQGMYDIRRALKQQDAVSKYEQKLKQAESFNALPPTSINETTKSQFQQFKKETETFVESFRETLKNISIPVDDLTSKTADAGKRINQLLLKKQAQKKKIGSVNNITSSATGELKAKSAGRDFKKQLSEDKKNAENTESKRQGPTIGGHRK